MKLKNHESGAISGLLISLILTVLLLFGALGFGTWAFMSREDYRNNVEEKIDEAVEVAVKRAETKKENEFVEREKRPLTTYRGPQSLGSMKVKYPKTWSVYVDESDSSEITILAHPKFVPAGDGGNPAYALKIEVVNENYDQSAGEYESAIESGEAKARPYKLPKQPKIIGLRVDGSLNDDHRGSAVILPLRDKTIIISTLSEQFRGDFDNIILKNFNFIP